MPQASLMYRDLGRQLPQSRSPTSLSGCGESPGIFSSICFRILFFSASRLVAYTQRNDSDNALLIWCIEEVGGHSTHTTRPGDQLSIFAQTKLKARPRIRAGRPGMALSQARRPKRKRASVCGMGACSFCLFSLPQKTSRGPLGLVGAGHAAAVKREMRTIESPYRPVETVCRPRAGYWGGERSKFLQGRSPLRGGCRLGCQSAPFFLPFFFLRGAP